MAHLLLVMTSKPVIAFALPTYTQPVHTVSTLQSEVTLKAKNFLGGSRQENLAREIVVLKERSFRLFCLGFRPLSKST